MAGKKAEAVQGLQCTNHAVYSTAKNPCPSQQSVYFIDSSRLGLKEFILLAAPLNLSFLAFRSILRTG
jgi:hypothetical protein